MSDKITVTRNQLAKFLPTPELIKAFEGLFKKSTVETPTDIESLSIDLATTSSSANEAIATSEGAIGIAIQSAIEPKNTDDAIYEVYKTTEELKASPNQLHDATSEIMKALESILSAPPQDQHRFADLDFIQFRNTYQRVKLPGQLHWSYTYGDLQFTHIGGLVQNLGLDTVAHVYNNSGAAINKGQVVYFTGVSAGDITIQKYIADGSISSLYIMGLASEDIANGEHGHVSLSGYVRDINASGSLYTETWNVGDILYASPTVSGGMTKTKPTAPNNCTPMAVVLDNSSTVGDLYVRTLVEQQFHYGVFVDTTTQTPLAINTAYAITLNTTSLSNGVSRGTPTSRIVVTTSGLYTFAVSIQLQSTNASIKNVWIWFRKNGVDIANSATKISLESASAITAPSLSFAVSLAANDYVEVMYAADNTAISLTTVASTAFAPACPSIIVVVEQTAQ